MEGLKMGWLKYLLLTVFTILSAGCGEVEHSDFGFDEKLIDGKIRLHIFVDWLSVEVFINGGETVITNRIFPDPASSDVVIFSEGGSASFTGLDFWSLKSIWN